MPRAPLPMDVCCPPSDSTAHELSQELAELGCGGPADSTGPMLSTASFLHKLSAPLVSSNSETGTMTYPLVQVRSYQQVAKSGHEPGVHLQW